MLHEPVRTAAATVSSPEPELVPVLEPGLALALVPVSEPGLEPELVPALVQASGPGLVPA